MDKNKELDVIEEMHLTGEAARGIQHSGENYDPALEVLRNRFSHKRTIEWNSLYAFHKLSTAKEANITADLIAKMQSVGIKKGHKDILTILPQKLD